MKPYIRRLRDKVLNYLILVCVGALPFNLPAANLVNTYTDQAQGITYNLYDDNTGQLVDAHKLNKASIVLTGIYGAYVMTKIADEAFMPSGVLSDVMTSLKIKDGIKDIGAAAFKNCSKLKDIYLPPTLETVDASAFDGCTALTNIYFMGYTVPKLTGGDNFTGIDLSTVNVYVHEGCADLFGAADSPFSGVGKINEVGSASLGSEDAELMLSKTELIFTPGTTQTLHISLENAEAYRGLQFDMYLPDGLSLAGDENNSYGVKIEAETIGSGKVSHTIKVSKVTNGSYRFVTYSPNDENFVKSKNLITVSIAVADDFQGGKIIFKDATASTVKSTGTTGFDLRDKSYEASLPEVPVTSIAIDKTEVTLQATQTATLSVSYTPTNATNKKVTWKSSDTSVATISADGVVTAVKVGTATITATTPNGVTATAQVTVEPTPATSVKIATPTTTTLDVGETLTLSATVLPELTTDKTITWTSSNADVATVDSNGKVTAKKAGAVEISATCGTVSDKVSLVITNLVKSLTLNSDEFRIEKGRNTILVATYSPSDAEPINLVWSSSDASIATVDASGKVTCIKPGTATVTVRDTESGLSASCEIIVTDTLIGDADNDGNIAINDVVLIVNHILELNPMGFVADRADVDRNGKINIVDVTMTVDLILAQTPESVSRARTSMTTRTPNDVFVIDDISFKQPGRAVIPVHLDTDMAYTGMQFDLRLPEGLEMEDIMLDASQGGGYMVSSLRLGESFYRIMIFSSNLDIFAGDSKLMDITLKVNGSNFFGGGTAEIFNGIASTVNGRGEAIGDGVVTIAPFSGVEEVIDEAAIDILSEAGGIRVNAIPGTTVNIYNMAGGTVISKVSTGDDYYPLQQGVYIVIVDGKSYKIMVKP